MSASRRRARMNELRSTRALEGLPQEAASELSQLEGSPSGAPDDYELAAATLYLAMNHLDEDPCPQPLLQKLQRSALEYL
jgi:hypothetical protein